MNREIISLEIKRIEKELPKLSSQVSTAAHELVAAGKLLTTAMERLVLVALELEELYISSGDIPPPAVESENESS